MTLTAEQWRQVNALFDAAVERSPGEWPALLEKGAADAAVRREVEELLRSHVAADTFLSKPVAQLSPKSLLSRLGQGPKAQRKLSPGETVGDFRIVRLLGEGGFARVYQADQLSLGRQVALKVTGNVGREAQTMAGLEHDHIVQVYSEAIDAQGDQRMICMQLVPGTTLQTVIDRLAEVPPAGRSGTAILAVIDQADSSATAFNAAAVKDREGLSQMEYLTACLWIGARLADALSFAHSRGILHLDVKPANILVNRYGRAMLTDFNVSLSPDDLASRNPAMLGGTISYMSPEHYELFTTKDMTLIDDIGPRSDIYALGVVLTELLTCHRAEKTIEEATGRTLLGHTDDLPEEIASVLHRAVSTRSRDRFASAAEMADALENCSELLAIRRLIPVKGHVMSWATKHPVTAVVALAILPQVMGSLVNITYNSARIVSVLSPNQQRIFMDTLLPYNLIFYPLGFWIVWRQVAFIFKSLRIRHDRVVPDPASMAQLRKRVLQTPYAMVIASTIGWVPAAYVFPATIDFLDGPITRSVYVHFAISFFLSYLVALTYSFLLIESVTLLVIYPRFWTGCCNVRDSSRFELRKVGRRLKLFQFLAGLIPLAGAMLIVGASPGIKDPQDYYVFQVMVVGLISLGMCGFVFAMKTSENIKRTVAAFAK